PEFKNPADERVQYVKDSGNRVGLLARQLFPGGVDASPPDAFSYQQSVIKTRELIAQGASIIYEAAFQHEGVLCAVDILVNEGEAWRAYEVKGTGRVKPQHTDDAAFQYYVIRNSGIVLADIAIVYLNTQYIRRDALEAELLFKKQSILHEVIDLQNTVQQKITALKNVLKQPEPETDIGPHCSTPYDCDFTNYCHAHVPKIDSVFELAPQTAWKLYAGGYLHLDQIPRHYPLNYADAHQLAHYRSGEISVNQQALHNFLQGIQYPVYFLDFETVWPGVPEFNDTKPFQHIPFQFSLHVQHTADSVAEHYEFLGDGHTDPREALTAELMLRIGAAGTILCYNTTFEKLRLKELAQHYPEHANVLMDFSQRLTDLMTPFQKRWYYHPEFKGGYSIKTVLPILCPDLRYNKLPIQEGQMAGIVYAQLKLQDAHTAALQREHLLAYCKMDTWAMVRVLECLRKLK
ncbi:MAG TPA: DUF2779 domain-containing protein, partial [Cyclobacteriaceae bacterium]|nr:DUF2779 domain-containing protein [Cyclobacteriaceae bacterium]